MKKGIDYSLEETKLVAIINAIILKAKNMKEKARMDNDCRTVTALCGEVVKLQAVLDKHVVEENESLRKRIHDHLIECGYDEHGINELFVRDHKVKLYQADNYTLRLYISNYKKNQALVASDAMKKK